MTGTTYSLKAGNHYIPALDGLRAVAVMLVVVSHGGLGDIISGNLGVMIFFVISGFLISRQLIAELETKHTLDLKAFYLRRAFRLIPAMLVYIAFFACILVPFGMIITPMHMMSACLYFVNYYKIYVNYPLHNPMPILWSLSVEEHFYIIFPWVLLAFRRKLPFLINWLWIMVVLALLWRLVLTARCSADPEWFACGLPGELRFHGTDTIFDGILYGVIAALLMQYGKNNYIRRVMHPYAAMGALLLLIATLVIRSSFFRDTLRFSLQGLSIAIIIPYVLFSSDKRCKNWLEIKPLVYIGRLSYSLYLYHFGVMVTIDLFQNRYAAFAAIPQMPLYFGASLLLAILSYHFIERPFIKLRKRWGSQTAG